MAVREDLLAVLSSQRDRCLAREPGFRRGDVEEGLRHALRSARAAGRAVLSVSPGMLRESGRS